jgi:hypothetical protein
MGRRKIRHFGGRWRAAYILRPGETLKDAISYDLRPEESLAPANVRSAIRDAPKPRLGKGSGRAGGARSATHKADHIRAFGIYPGTTVEECPICRFGMVVWKLWVESGRPDYSGNEASCFEPGSWEEKWEGNDEERLKCERFFSNYEACASLACWDVPVMCRTTQVNEKERKPCGDMRDVMI